MGDLKSLLIKKHVSLLAQVGKAKAVILLIEFSATDVLEKNASNLERVLNDLEKNSEQVRQVQGTLMLAFPDFEDAEVVFLVPEVKSFLRKAHQQVKHLWYYLVPDPEYSNLLMFMAVHAPEEQVTIVNSTVRVNPDTNALMVLVDRLIATVCFAKRMADDPMEIVSQILAPLEADLRQKILNAVTSALDC